MGLVIHPKMRNLQEIIGFLTKIQLFESVCFNNNRVATQHAPIFVHLIITSFSVTLFITLKTACFFVKYQTNSLIHEA